MVFWVSPYLSFSLSAPERLHCCYIDFHCSDLYSYYNSSRTLCIKCWDSAFRTEFQHFILRFPYFTDTTKRGVRRWKTGWRQGEDRVTLRISLMRNFSLNITCIWISQTQPSWVIFPSTNCNFPLEPLKPKRVNSSESEQNCSFPFESLQNLNALSDFLVWTQIGVLHLGSLNPKSGISLFERKWQ
jgi:hypothetical protein